jgi:hypothetical protein
MGRIYNKPGMGLEKMGKRKAASTLGGFAQFPKG